MLFLIELVLAIVIGCALWNWIKNHAEDVWFIARATLALLVFGGVVVLSLYVFVDVSVLVLRSIGW